MGQMKENKEVKQEPGILGATKERQSLVGRKMGQHPTFPAGTDKFPTSLPDVNLFSVACGPWPMLQGTKHRRFLRKGL